MGPTTQVHDVDTDRVRGATFESLGLERALAGTCEQMGLKWPTAIQRAAIPPLLTGRSLLAQSRTGSGKTAAFALPILHRLGRDPFGVFAVVLTPARELAMQIAEQFRALGVTIGLQCSLCIGGMDMMVQACDLEKRPHVIVATPGRLADHLMSATSIHLSHTQILVLDEADRLLEPSFAKDLDIILNALPSKRQTMLFSATFSPAMLQVHKVAMPDALIVRSNGEGDKCITLTKINEDSQVIEEDKRYSAMTVAQLDQRYLFCPRALRDCGLVHILEEKLGSRSTCIIFVSSCASCEVVSETLQQLGINCVSLHSKLTQNRRAAALGKFRSGLARLLVCTDVASRGLDIPHVAMVVNHNVPCAPADYVHRVGRTARAGRAGVAVTIVTERDIELIHAIEEEIGTQLEELVYENEQLTDRLKAVNPARRMAKLRLDEYEWSKKQTADGLSGRKRKI